MKTIFLDEKICLKQILVDWSNEVYYEIWFLIMSWCHQVGGFAIIAPQKSKNIWSCINFIRCDKNISDLNSNKFLPFERFNNNNYHNSLY